MTKAAAQNTEKRAPLGRERVLRSAMAIADENGIAALTMRSLAQELGVKPMALYYHVANKAQILDGIVDLVFSEIELPHPDRDWRAEIARRSGSARQILRRPPWATWLMDASK